jgi:hypothetical protein
VNKYVDSLKFITFTTTDDDQESKPAPAFKDVVLSSFGLNTGSKDSNQAASYTITLSYDPTIFDITKNVQLTVPSVTTTRAQISQPSDLFQASPVPAAGGSR